MWAREREREIERETVLKYFFVSLRHWRRNAFLKDNRVFQLFHKDRNTSQDPIKEVELLI